MFEALKRLVTRHRMLLDSKTLTKALLSIHQQNLNWLIVQIFRVVLLIQINYGKYNITFSITKRIKFHSKCLLPRPQRRLQVDTINVLSRAEYSVQHSLQNAIASVLYRR